MKRINKRKIIIRLGIPLLILLLLFLFRKPIMRGMGNYLVYEDEPVKVDAMYVLSGGAEERARKAAEIYHAGFSSIIFCTGEEESMPKSETEMWTTGEVTRFYIWSHGVDSSAVQLINEGTSTWEESEVILEHAQTNDYETVMIVSSNFHTRRIRQVFEDKFEKAGIEVNIQGAESDRFDPDHWWESESGLVNLNNEYIKIIFYKLNY